jgi:hypothetical protein
MPLLDAQEFRELLAASDVRLVTQQRMVSDIIFPSKAVTYLSAGRPVIASVNRASEVARVIRESNAGAVVEPENAEALRKQFLTCGHLDVDARTWVSGRESRGCFSSYACSALKAANRSLTPSQL